MNKANSSSLEMGQWNGLPALLPTEQVDYWIVEFIDAMNYSHKSCALSIALFIISEYIF